MVEYYQKQSESNSDIMIYVAKDKDIHYTLRSDQDKVSEISIASSDPITDLEAGECLQILLDDDIQPCEKEDLPEIVVKKLENKMN